jgi:hypothetical protein
MSENDPLATKTGLTAAERRLRASIAVNTSWARTDDRLARTEPGRRAAEARFERLVDPDGVLTPDELARRVANARRAHFQQLALRSAKARRLRRGAGAA